MEINPKKKKSIRSTILGSAGHPSITNWGHTTSQSILMKINQLNLPHQFSSGPEPVFIPPPSALPRFHGPPLLSRHVYQRPPGPWYNMHKGVKNNCKQIEVGFIFGKNCQYRNVYGSDGVLHRPAERPQLSCGLLGNWMWWWSWLILHAIWINFRLFAKMNQSGKI